MIYRTISRWRDKFSRKISRSSSVLMGGSWLQNYEFFHPPSDLSVNELLTKEMFLIDGKAQPNRFTFNNMLAEFIVGVNPRSLYGIRGATMNKSEIENQTCHLELRSIKLI